MSFTGVVLMYERQIDEWAASRHYVAEAEQTQRLSLDQLLLIQQTKRADLNATAVVVTNDPGAPVSIRAGRQGALNLNPYTGAEMETGSPSLDAFFSAMTGFHRWFNITGENRAVARQVTGVSNVIFLFLVISGMYLWLPKIWQWTMFKVRLLFRSSYPASKVRDYHWHHIFGIWAAVPLLAVVYSGAVISYPWAANLMYRAFGAEVPVASGPGRGGPEGQGRAQNQVPVATFENQADRGSLPATTFLPLDALLTLAIDHSSNDWNRLNVTLPATGASTLEVEVDRGNGAQAHKRHTLSLDRSSGAIVNVRTFADTPESQRLRGIARFLHTGEVLGFWGQTIAGLASFAALFMVWTGFALSWRRLIQPWFRKKNAL